jgi:plastocyanin
MMDPKITRPDFYGEVRLRLPLPIVIPLGALLLIALVAFSFSRVLLAVTEEIAVAIAAVAALNILGACSVLALRPRMRPANYVELAVVVLYPILIGVVIAAAGIGTEAAPAEEAPPPAAPDDLVLGAEGVQFDTDQLTLLADEEAVLTFNNDDTVPHDFNIYETEADMQATENALFDGQIIDGGQSTEYIVPPLDAGEYLFQCDLHPGSMVGTLVAE